eukprot:TRINITY_DN44754_c0_g1_i1.p1 TRINITY_DN44754_c0_g1~~TRINITY_DN44754_c0_g1_i1.p1  ORF type:complete len:102 (-),score=6.43 TRINITY_DN44754_c0_g1_i1:201-506(-)
MSFHLLLLLGCLRLVSSGFLDLVVGDLLDVRQMESLFLTWRFCVIVSFPSSIAGLLIVFHDRCSFTFHLPTPRLHLVLAIFAYFLINLDCLRFTNMLCLPS